MNTAPATRAGLPADPHDLAGLAATIAREVSSELMASLEDPSRSPTVSTKSGETDLVTDLDRWAESHIVGRLLGARPDDGVLGAEGSSVAGTSGVEWCIDPIDGTVNFVHGIPGFCVSIAAQVDGASMAAVVASPMTGEVFEATIGGGAQRDGRPIRCSFPPDLARAVIGTGFGYDPARRRRQASVLERVIASIADIRRSGAATTDLCWVACGRLDGYWEVGLNPWDHAAGALIATEAGARVASFDGGPPSGASLLAAPPALWDRLCDLLTAAGAQEV